MESKSKQLLQRRFKAFEQKARDRGYRWIAGVDEAGRGPLAGPVVAAACILPPEIELPGIKDSKQLSAKQREEFYQQLEDNPSIVKGVGIIEALIIDQVNILQATLLAMVAAIAKLYPKPDYVLVDGNRVPPLEMDGEAIVQGDQLSESIMAAAIIAKVTRDKMMLQYHTTWPQYEFADHKGYPTPRHLEILKKLGPSPIHRLSYTPVRECT